MSRRAVLVLLAGASCAGPSRSETNARAEEARRLMRARAVHMPPAGVESCVGVTVRLTEGSAGAETERAALAVRLGEEEVESAVAAAGIQACRDAYVEGVERSGIAEEPLQIKLGYAVDPNGRVCAVVERERTEPIDPSAAALFEGGAECLKGVLFRAEFPAGRVKDLERIVRFYSLVVDPTETIKAP